MDATKTDALIDLEAGYVCGRYTQGVTHFRLRVASLGRFQIHDTRTDVIIPKAVTQFDKR